MESGRRFPLIGQIVGENYLVIDATGEGPVIVSYEGKDCADDRAIVIKGLRKQNSELADSFRQSAQKTAKLKHKNIATPIWASQDATADPCMVFESNESITLEELVLTMGQIEDEESLGSMLLQICDALEYAHHQQLLHGALTPKNILLLQKGDEVEVLVTDFSIASLITPEAFETACGGSSTELVYAAPERYTGGRVTLNADVYSLGAIAYYMITGKPPYAAHTLDELKHIHSNGQSAPPHLSKNINLPGVPQLDSLIQEALNKDPEWRLSTVTQFKERIKAWADSPGSQGDDFEDFDGQGFDELEDEDFVEDQGVEWNTASNKPTVIHANVQNFDSNNSIPPVPGSVSPNPAAAAFGSTGSMPAGAVPPSPAAKAFGSADSAPTVAAPAVPPTAPAVSPAPVPPGVHVHNQAPQAVPSPNQSRDVVTSEANTGTLAASAASDASIGAPSAPVTFISTDPDGFTSARSIESDSRPQPPPPPHKPRTLQGFEPITPQEQQKLESMVMEGAETNAPPTATPRRRPARKKKKMVTTTVRNLIALRQSESDRSEGAAMQFTGHFKAEGTRQSPMKTLVRLVATTLVFCASAAFIVLNFGELKKMFFAASLQIEPLFRKQTVAEKDKDWEEAVNKEAKQKVATASTKTAPPTATAGITTPPAASGTTKPGAKVKPAEAPPARALNELEKRTPLGSEYYSKGMFSRSSMNNNDPKLGNRRRIDYREFNLDWLK